MKDFIFDLQRYAPGKWTGSYIDNNGSIKSVQGANGYFNEAHSLLPDSLSAPATLYPDKNASFSNAPVNVTKNVIISLSGYSWEANNALNISSNITIQSGTLAVNSSFSFTGESLVFEDLNVSLGTAQPFEYKNITYTGSGLTLYYEDSEDNSKAVTLTNLPSSFSVKSDKDDEVVTYSLSGTNLSATQSNVTKYYIGTANKSDSYVIVPGKGTQSEKDISFDSGLREAITISGGNVSLSADSNSGDFSKTIISKDKYSSIYGSFVKDGENYSLQSTNNRNSTLTGITVNDGLKLNIAKEFSNASIVAVEKATLKSNDDSDFTVDASGSIASFTGNNVSLISGTIQTDAETITGGGKMITGGGNDGFIFIVSGSNAILGDIDDGESFTLNLKNGTSKIYKNANGVGITSDGSIYSGSETSDANGTYAVDLNSLVSNMKQMIAPADDNVLTIDNSIKSAVAVDDTTSPTEKYAEISYSSNKYTFSSITGGNFSPLGTGDIAISVAGAKFKVTNTDNETFTVSSSNSKPAVISANALTLLDGSIVASQNQDITLTLGETEKSLTVTAGTDVEVAKSNENYIITASVANDAFNINGSSYTVTGSDKMNFLVGSGEYVTISGLDKANEDSFIFGGTSYSVRGAGFIKQTSTNDYQIWSADNTHSLTDNSVSSDSLSKAQNWSEVQLSNNSAVTLDTNATLAVIVDSVGFSNTYGTLTKSGYTYTLTKGDGDETLTSVNLGSANGLIVGSSGLTNVSISSNGKATLSITEDTTADNGYTVTILGSMASVTGADKVSLIGGKAQFDSTTTYQADGKNYVALANSDIELEVSGTSATIGGLSEGESFQVGGTSYTLQSNGRFIDSDRKIWNKATISVSNGSVTAESLLSGDNWNGVIEVTVNSSDKILSLNDNIDSVSSATYYLVDKTSSEIYGTIDKKSGNNYVLSTVDATNDFTTISIGGSAKSISITPDLMDDTISTDIATFKVTTVDSGEGFVVNYATSKVSVTKAKELDLMAGTLSVDKDSPTIKANTNTIYVDESDSTTVVDVTNDKTNSKVTIDGLETAEEQVIVNNNTYSPTSGNGIKIEISGTSESVTSIDAGDIFTIKKGNETTTFTRTTSGDFIKTTDNSTYYLWTGGNSDTVSVNDLLKNQSKWAEILPAPKGEVEIDSNLTGSSYSVVDISQIASGISTNYGSLEKTSGTYTLTADKTNLLTGIKLDSGVKATIPKELQGATITAGQASFTVKTSKSFNVDASKTYPTISDVNSITLTDGEIYANKGTPITVNSKTVVATNGEMTVGIKSGKGYVTNLNPGDSFTVDGVSYTETAAGLVDDKNNKLVPGVTTTYNFEDSFEIIGLNGTTLDLSKQITSALVYDSAKKPTTFLATLLIGSALELNGESLAAEKIKSINIAKDTNFNVDFATTVNAPKGNTTVNGQTYDGTSKLVIDSDGSSSTLWDGTVKLDSGTTSVTSTSDGALEISKGSANVTVAKGKFTQLSGLDAGETFTYDGKTYTQSAVGLINGTTISEELAGESIDVRKLSSAKFVEMLAAPNEILNLSDVKNSAALVVDDITNPKKKFGNLTKSDNVYTLDFAIRVQANGSVTVNGKTYNSSGKLTLDVTEKSSTLYDGTVDLESGESVTADQTLTLNSGSAQVVAASGKLTTVIGLDVGESFTYGGKTYIQTELGLATEGTLCADITGTTIDLSKLSDANWAGVIAPVDGVIDLSSVKGSATVVDNLTKPTKTLGTLTKDGSNYTLDFPIQIKTSDAVTVNGKSYTPDGDILLDVTAKTSTLKSGTITLTDSEVKTSSGKTVSATAGSISVTAGDDITIGDLSAGDTFTIDGTTYTRTAAGLFKGDLIFTDKLDSSVTLKQLASKSWSNVIKISDNTLDLTKKLGSGLLVSDDVSKIYGTLTKTSDGYSLTVANNANADLATIKVNGTKLEIAPEFVDVPLSTDDSTFADIKLDSKLKPVTFDATNPAPVLSNVNSFTLTNGKVQLNPAQTVTSGENVLTANTGNFIVTDDEISGIDSGDEFTLNGVEFKMTSLGLIAGENLVVRGFDNDTLTISNLQISPLITPVKGVINLDEVKSSAAVVDNLDNPTKVLGTLTKDGSTYKLDFAIQVKTSASATVNGKAYTPKDTVILDVTAKTSTLKSGTVTIDNSSVMTSSGKTVSAKGSISVTAGDDISVSELDAGDSFSIDNENYSMSPVAPLHDDKIWNSKLAKSYSATQLAKAENWSPMFAVPDGKLKVDAKTLADGKNVVLVDNDDYPTKIYGLLSKDDGEYTLSDDTATDVLKSITIDKALVNIDNDLSGVQITTISKDGTESIFTAIPSGEEDTFQVDATGDTTKLDRVSEIEISKGKVQGGDGVIVKPADGAEDVTVLLGNGNHTVGDEYMKIEGLKDDSYLEATFDDNGEINALKGMEKDSTVTIDGITYTAPEDDTTLNHSDKDGWYFDDYVLDAYTVTVGKKGTVSVDPGVKFTDVVQSGMNSDGNIKLSADLYDTPVTINNTGKTALKITDENGTLIESLAKDSTATVFRDGDEIIVTADEGTEMTLTAEDYVINGVAVTTKGDTKAVATANGVEIDLGKSATLTVGNKTISGTGKITLDNAGNIIVEGTVKIDGVTINSDSPVNMNVIDAVKVEGDTQYKVNVEGGKVVGLENIGGNVKISGLNNATVKTNATGTVTVDNKSFTAGAGTTYTLENGKFVAAQVKDTISGDFSGGLTVNDNPVTVKGGEVTVTSGGDIQAGAGSYTVNGHSYTTSNAATYHTNAGKVTGIDLTSGNLTVAQDETNFKVNDETLTLANNKTPVSLGITDGAVTTVDGVNGGSIDGLKDATVYNAGNATVNGKKLSVSGSDCAAIVMNSETVGLAGIKSGATITSAPDLTIKTSENGTYSVNGKNYKITDEDGSVEIVTDKNSDISDINDFAGSISGTVGELRLNGKDFGSSNGAVTVATDGEDITQISGVKNGDSIGGDLEKVTFILPEGTVTINDNELNLSGESSVEVSDGGKAINGLTKDASLKASEGGVYKVNGKEFAAGADTSFTVNRDGAYAINPNFLPIIESTPAKVVSDRGFTLQESDGTASGSTVVVRNNAKVRVTSTNTNLIATSGEVTLQNYADNDSVQTYEYTNTTAAIIDDNIKFGDGKMTLCDATITFNEKASTKGATMMKLLNAVGSELRVGFTHTAGGTIDESSSETSMLLKGNYAAKSGDTQKSGGSNLKSGAGNDTLLIGSADTADAGAGSNTIYITDSRFRDKAATIYFNEGINRVVNFNNGYTDKSDVIQVSDISGLSFQYGGTRFTMNLQSGQMYLENAGNNLGRSDDSADDSYKLKISDGKRTYNTAVATYGSDINVTDDEVTELYYGDNSGINFSEYSGAVSVNLNTGKGSIKSKSAAFQGINRVEGGKGSAQIHGADGVSNTLIAGTGNGSLFSGSGADLMVGKSNKTGTTTFYYLEGDGRDSITGFDFAASADKSGDLIDITRDNAVTDVWIRGKDIVMQINESADDYLTLANAKGKDFRINNLIAQVDNNVSYDGMANCYVADAKNATMMVGENMGNAQVWLNDNATGLHGTYYLGDIKVIDAHEANGSNILAGNALDNVVIGGTGVNSIWGGYGDSNDTLIGGSGQNTFFFALENGNDVVQNAHDGDVIDLRHVLLEHVTSAEISATGVKLELKDGSTLDVKSNANMEYRLHDGTYIADHATREWTKK